MTLRPANSSSRPAAPFAGTDQPRVWFAFAPPESIGERQIVSYQGCKNPSCRRYSCVASAEWCWEFCCPGCASQQDHTPDCDEYFPAMRARIVPGFDSIPYDRFVQLVKIYPPMETEFLLWAARVLKTANAGPSEEIEHAGGNS
jgi:hypothetical protein